MVGVGGGTEADVGNVVPITGVMAGTEGGGLACGQTVGASGEVRDFVVLVAGGGEAVDEGVVHPALQFLIHYPLSIVHYPLSKWGSFLNHEAIGRDVFHVEGQCGVDVALPVVKGLAGEAVHQVDADVADARIPKDGDGTADLCGGVAATEEAEALVVEGLGAHGDAVDAEPRQCLGVRDGDVVGVHLDGDLEVKPPPVPLQVEGGSIRRTVPMIQIHLINIYKELFELGDGQLGGGAAAEVDGGDGLGGKTAENSRSGGIAENSRSGGIAENSGGGAGCLGAQLHLATDGIDVLLAQVETGGRVEAAVDAAGGAKGDVYV